MRIALFTPFSPDLGGGSVQLKGLLPRLAKFDIDWYYLASAKAPSGVGTWLGTQLMGGPLLRDLGRDHRSMAARNVQTHTADHGAYGRGPLLDRRDE